MNDTQIIPLQTLYLAALCATAEAENLSTFLQDTGNNTGRLWLAPPGSTVPHAQIGFQFGLDDVKLLVIHRDERQLAKCVRYAEGLDGFLEELTWFMRANRLAAPKRTFDDAWKSDTRASNGIAKPLRSQA